MNRVVRHMAVSGSVMYKSLCKQSFQLLRMNYSEFVYNFEGFFRVTFKMASQVIHNKS